MNSGTAYIGAKVLIVDDVPANLNLLREVLELMQLEILAATSGESACRVAFHAKPDLILLDVVLGGIDGFETCRRLKAEPTTEQIPVIFITAKDTVEELVAGFKAGGVDYITKPFHEQEVIARVQTHLNMHQLRLRLEERNQQLQQEIEQRRAVTSHRDQLSNRLSFLSQQEAERWGVDAIVGESQTLRRILKRIHQLQITATTSVLITGESGTGKELIARSIHAQSVRASEPFIAVNCSAIPSELAESTLFGHVRGAFTGATKDQSGHFLLADGGTLFLDEIGDMPLDTQAKLLRVLEDGVVTPLGASQGKRVDVRILAATNANLLQQTTDGMFREDLYFRLARFQVEVSPLRERKEDIPLLASHFLQLFAREMALPTPELSSSAVDKLVAYPFPGNIRELKNTIESALIESGGDVILPCHLHFTHHAVPDSNVPSATIPLNLEQAEAFVVTQALEQTQGNISQAAQLLGTNRNRIYRILARTKSLSLT